MKHYIYWFQKEMPVDLNKTKKNPDQRIQEEEKLVGLIGYPAWNQKAVCKKKFPGESL